MLILNFGCGWRFVEPFWGWHSAFNTGKWVGVTAYVSKNRAKRINGKLNN